MFLFFKIGAIIIGEETSPSTPETPKRSKLALPKDARIVLEPLSKEDLSSVKKSGE